MERKQQGKLEGWGRGERDRDGTRWGGWDEHRDGLRGRKRTQREKREKGLKASSEPTMKKLSR